MPPFGLGLLMGLTRNSGGAAWDPSVVASKHLEWFRADSLVTGTTWTGKTNGTVATATTVTQDSSGLNGKKRIVFPNSANNQLTATVSGTGSLTKGQLFVVGKWAGGTASIWNLGQGSPGYLSFGGAVYENGLSTARQGPFTHSLSAGDPFVYEVKADASGNVDYRINGVSIGTITGNTVQYQVAGVTILGGNSGGTYMNGEIEEILLLNDLLTSGEHTSLATYFNTMYGVTL